VLDVYVRPEFFAGEEVEPVPTNTEDRWAHSPRIPKHRRARHRRPAPFLHPLEKTRIFAHEKGQFYPTRRTQIREIL
jgi:hypothetical protein